MPWTGSPSSTSMYNAFLNPRNKSTFSNSSWFAFRSPLRICDVLFEKLSSSRAILKFWWIRNRSSCYSIFEIITLLPQIPSRSLCSFMTFETSRKGFQPAVDDRTFIIWRARDWDFARYKLHSCNSCERAGPNVETVNEIIIHISQHRKQMADSSFDLCVFYAKCWTLSTAARRELLTTQTMAASLFV